MVNGSGTANWGTYNYFDTTYSGSGNKNAEGTIFDANGKAIANPAAMLNGGKGLLTDGVIATQNYSQVSPGQYVGWKYHRSDDYVSSWRRIAASRGFQSPWDFRPSSSPMSLTATWCWDRVWLGHQRMFKLSINGGASTTLYSRGLVGYWEFGDIDHPISEFGRGRHFHPHPGTRAVAARMGIFYNNFYNGDPANHIGDPQFYLNAGQPNLRALADGERGQFLAPCPSLRPGS